MKRIRKFFISVSTIIALFSPVCVYAYSGSYSDSRLDLIWWSQGGGSNMYWTGVTNKLTYDYYRPCVGAANSEFACGVAASYSTYKEYGRWLYSGVSQVVHGVSAASGNYNYLEYPQTVTVQDSDR